MASSSPQIAPSTSSLPPILPKPLSYAAAVSKDCNTPFSPRSSAKSFDQILSNGGKVKLKEPGVFRGEPAVFFSNEEISELANPFRFTLVGKFSYGRPPMTVIRKFFTSLGLKSLKSVGLLHEKHVVVFLNQEEDYTRLILRSIWYVSGSPMKMLKWSPEFIPSFESPVVPVWVGFPGLPIHFFEKSALFNIASVFGTPLKLDEPTTLLSRPSVARVCIEVDVSKSKNQRLWIGSEKEGYWQEAVFEDLPKYCIFCQMLGHEDSVCFVQNPYLKKDSVSGKNFNTVTDGRKVHLYSNKGKEKEHQPIAKEGDWQVVRKKYMTTEKKNKTIEKHTSLQETTQEKPSTINQASSSNALQQHSETVKLHQTEPFQPSINIPASISKKPETRTSFQHQPVDYQTQSANGQMVPFQQVSGNHSSVHERQIPAERISSFIDSAAPLTQSELKGCVSVVSERNRALSGKLLQKVGQEMDPLDGQKNNDLQAAGLFLNNEVVGSLKGAGESSTGPVLLEETFNPNAIPLLNNEGHLCSPLEKEYMEGNHSHFNPLQLVEVNSSHNLSHLKEPLFLHLKNYNIRLSIPLEKALINVLSSPWPSFNLSLVRKFLITHLRSLGIPIAWNLSGVLDLFFGTVSSSLSEKKSINSLSSSSSHPSPLVIIPGDETCLGTCTLNRIPSPPSFQSKLAPNSPCDDLVDTNFEEEFEDANFSPRASCGGEHRVDDEPDYENDFHPIQGGSDTEVIMQKKRRKSKKNKKKK